MLNIAEFLIKQSGLVPDNIRAVGLAREANSPYERQMQERRRAREESERLGWEKLQNTLRTGQGYQDWMGEYFLDGLGLRNLKQLDDPKVQEYFLRRAEGKDPGDMHAVGLYQPAGFFKKRDSENRLLNAAVEYIKNKRNAAASSTASPAAPATKNPFGGEDADDLAGNTEVSDADAFAKDVGESLDELGQYESKEDTGDFDGKIEDPDLIEKQVNYAPAPATSQAQVPIKTPTSTPAADAKNPLISIEQARGLLARGIAPTSIGGYAQILGADGTNVRAQQELELMDKDPTYNPFANTQAKYVQKLNRMRLLDQYDPKVIMAENQRIQQNQAKLDADRRSRMDAAQYYANQGVQGAQDYHSYMTRGGQLSQAGQQWRDNFNVVRWNQQQAQMRRQQAQPQQTQWKSELNGPRDPGEQAYMRSVLGYADTGSGVGSHADGRTWAAKNNSNNGLNASAGKPVKNPITQPK